MQLQVIPLAHLLRYDASGETCVMFNICCCSRSVPWGYRATTLCYYYLLRQLVSFVRPRELDCFDT